MSIHLSATDYYVATNGSDSNSGTSMASPFKTLTKAVSTVQPGDYIYLRGGVHNYSSTIVISSPNGSSSQPIRVFAYSGESPVLNFSSQSVSGSNRGIVMDANYWHWQGITIQGAGDNGMLLSGNNNRIENCIFRRNRDSGLQLSRYRSSANSISQWPSNNTIIGCESYDNADPANEDADGFAAKLTCGTGNRFINCVAHHNIDDGWDLFTKSDTGPIGEVYFEGCIAHSNGTLTNGTTSGNGDKNGFKLGSSAHKVDHTLIRCIAFNNGKHGFTDNGNIGNIKFINSTSYNNDDYNFHTRDGASHLFVNTLSYNSNNNDRIRGNASSYPNAFDNNDNWPHTASSSDFNTLSPGINNNPTSNGFLNLSAGSSLINAGSAYSGLTYSGSSPDLGAIEYGGSSDVPASISLSASGGDESISLSWSTTGTITSQEVYRNTNSNTSGRVRIATLSANDRNFTDNNVANGTTYYYWIKYNESQNSNTATATSTSPELPTIILEASGSSSAINLQWSVDNLSVSQQEVYRDTDSDPSGRVRIASLSSSSIRSYSDNSASPGTTYYYWIKINGSENSNFASASIEGGGDPLPGSKIRIEDTDPGTISYDGSLKNYSNADNGKAINLSNSAGKRIVWSYNASNSGSHTITLRYTRKASMNSSVDMIVNNGSAQTVVLPVTAGSAFKTTSFTANLSSGTNSIILEANASGESADIDWIEIEAGGSSLMNTSEALSSLNLQIFPNPAREMLTIQSGQATKVHIVDLQGVIINTFDLEGKQTIDVSNFRPGLYNLIFITQNESISKLFIKE